MGHHKIIPSLKTLTLFLAALLLVGPPLSGQHHIVIDSVIGDGRDAIHIKHATHNGIRINSAGRNGVYVGNAGVAGVEVGTSSGYGVYVNNAVNASAAGVYVSSAGGDGFSVHTAGDDGVVVGFAGGDGVRVGNAGGDGVYVGGAGGHSMNITGYKSASTLAGHIGLVYNKDNGTNADVLALKVGTTGNPAAGNNFITFYNGADASLGAVQGNGSGTVCYTTGGCDYAEYLPLLDHAETFSPGDIVGVYGGHISKQTANAQRVMVITDQAAVIGNKPMSTGDDEEIEGYETVSFIGQVRTKVRGKVQAGDWIVASGSDDGTGFAVAPTDIELNHQIVGRAWESSSEPEIKRINTAVGLDQSQMWTEVIRAQKTQIDELRQMIMEIKDFRYESYVKAQSQTK